MENTITEIKDWLRTYSGKLAVTASAIGTVLADNAITALGMAEFIPDGWPRALVLIGVAVATFITPMKALKKDAEAATNAE